MAAAIATVPRVPPREMTRLPRPRAIEARANGEHHPPLRIFVVQACLNARGHVLCVQGRGGGGAPPPAAGSDGLAVTEQQVAKLMEEDIGTAMQYLQGKGLCLMPVSLASAISSATCHMRPPVGGLGVAAAAHHMAAMRLPPPGINGGGADAAAAVPASPSMSVLTAQSAMANGAGGADGEGSHSQQQQPKDAASVSKP